MKANSFGKYFGIATFGESHGKAIGVLLQDVLPGIKFPYEEIKIAFSRRKTSSNPYSSQRKEADNFEVLSGVLNGVTTGMPICIIIYNKDHNSNDYENVKNIFRPSHADFSYYKKFKIYDYRGGGRASGRETIARVVAGELVDKLLEDIKIYAYPIKIGEIEAKEINLDFKNELNWYDKKTYPTLIKYLDNIKGEKDSVGGIVEVVIKNIPAGLGDPVFEKLDANLAKAVLSIGAIKGIEFGKGFELANMQGSGANDQINNSGFLSNNAGGIVGGISTGQDIVLRFVIKPTSSIGKQQKTVDIQNNEKVIKIKGRHDICIVPRILQVAVSMIKLTLADAISYQKLLSSQERKLNDYREAFDKIDEDILIAIGRRNLLARDIGLLKKRENLEIFDIKREEKVIVELVEKGKEWGLKAETIMRVWKTLLNESKDIQKKC